MSAATKMSAATEQKATGTARSAARRRVEAEISAMLQINGNTSTAQAWVPRVVMMAYERRCAGHPADGELAQCLSIARAIAAHS